MGARYFALGREKSSASSPNRRFVRLRLETAWSRSEDLDIHCADATVVSSVFVSDFIAIAKLTKVEVRHFGIIEENVYSTSSGTDKPEASLDTLNGPFINVPRRRNGRSGRGCHG
jgi:hypothetical protein